MIVAGSAALYVYQDRFSASHQIARLQEEKRALEARYAELEEMFRRLRKGKIDPLQQDETIRALAREKDELEAHTRRLEDGVRAMLTRVRFSVNE